MANLHRWIEYGILALILLGYLVVGSLYAFQTPNWQAPDEPAHYNYIQQLPDGCCPVIEMGDWNTEILDILKNERFPASRTDWIRGIEYEDHQPPLYYILGYASLFGADFVDDEIIAGLPGTDLERARLLSVMLGTGVVICAYVISRVMFPLRRGAALGTAALVAFIPQHVAILASVNNDALALLLVALTLLVCSLYVSNLNKKASLWRWHVALGMLVGLAFLTKTTAYFLVFIALIAVILRPLVIFAGGTTARAAGTAYAVMDVMNKNIPNLPKPDAKTRRRTAGSVFKYARKIYAPSLKRMRGMILRGWAVILAVSVTMGALWWVRNSIVYGFPDILGLGAHDEVVIGQLRTAQRIEDVGGFAPYFSGAVQTTFNSFWGQLGWMALPLPNWAYSRIGFMLVGAFAGVIFDIVVVFRIQKQKATMRQVAIGILLGLTGFFAAAAYIYYNLSFYQVQGRYLFTALIPFALLVAVGLDTWARWLGRRLPASLTPYAIYTTPLLLAGTFGAFNLWLIRYVLPFLSPV